MTLQLAKAMEDAREAKERGRELQKRGVLESDVHLLFDDKEFADHSQSGMLFALYLMEMNLVCRWGLSLWVTLRCCLLFLVLLFMLEAVISAW